MQLLKRAETTVRMRPNRLRSLLLVLQAVTTGLIVYSVGSSQWVAEAKRAQRGTDLSCPESVSDVQWSHLMTNYKCKPWCYRDFTRHTQKTHLHTVRVILTASTRFSDVYVALRSLSPYEHITVVATTSEPIPEFFAKCFPHVEFLKSPWSNHLSAAWNHAIHLHKENYDYFLICNDDVLFPNDWMKRLDVAIDRYADAAWIGTTQSIQFSGFLLPVSTWLSVGKFDEVYTAYFEDDDYWVRLEECYGNASKFRVTLYPMMQPVVYHRRVGWSKAANWTKIMRDNMRVSKLRFFNNWTPVDDSTVACKLVKCLKTRKNILVTRAPTYARVVKGPGCV